MKKILQLENFNLVFSVAEIVRSHILENLKNNYDYSTPKSRSDDFQNLMKKNTKVSVKHRSLYYNLFPRILEKQGLDPASYGMKRKNQFAKQAQSDMNSTITPKPKGTQEQKTEETKKDETKKEGTPEEGVQEISLTMSKLTCRTAYSIIKARFHWEGLTPDEEEALGEAWLPLLREYMTKYLLKFGLPLAITAGIFIDKNNRYQESKKREEKKGAPPDTPEEKKEKPKDKSVKEEVSGWLSEVGGKTE